MQQASQLLHTIVRLPLRQSQRTAHQRQPSLLTSPQLSSRSLNIVHVHSLQDHVPATLLLHQSQNQATLHNPSKSPAMAPNQPHRATSLNLQSPAMVRDLSRQGNPALPMGLQGLPTSNMAPNWSSSRGLQNRVTTRPL